MKQHITAEELKQLDFKQQKKIATLFGQFGNCVRMDKEGNEYFNLGMLSERINIGRMIECLMKHNANEYPLFLTDSRQYIAVECLSNYRGSSGYHVEMCDALWKGVRGLI